MNIIKRELKSNRKSIVVWSMGMIFLIIVGMVKYIGFRDSGEEMMAMLSSMPKPMLTVMGINSLDISSMSGYYIIFFLYFTLLCGIHGILLGATSISKEERDKTADFLLAKPIKRSKVMTSKIIASLILMATLNGVTWISSYISIPIFNYGNSIGGLLAELMMALFILQIIFFSIGLLIGVIFRKTKKATGVSTGVILGTFILSVMIDMYSKIRFLKYLTPFKYFDGKSIFLSGIDLKFVVISIIVISISIVISYKLFQDRDIHV